MRVTRLQLRDFRSYERGELRLGPGLTVVAGPNGAGKTNLLEAAFFALTGRSCRTRRERETIAFAEALVHERHCDVLERRGPREEVVALEHESEMIATEDRALVGVECGDLGTEEAVAAARREIETPGMSLRSTGSSAMRVD